MGGDDSVSVENRSIEHAHQSDYILLDIDVCDGIKSFLLDTGSEISLIPLSILKGDTEVDTNKEINIRGITGDSVKSRGLVKGKLKLGSQLLEIQFQVLPRSYKPIGIIGRDFMLKYKAILDYGMKRISIGIDSLPFGPEISETRISQLEIHVKGKFNFPKRMEKLTEINIKRKGDHVIIAREIFPGVHIGNCVVNCKNGPVRVPIINSNDYDVNTELITIDLEPFKQTSEHISFVSKSTNVETERSNIDRRKQVLTEVNINMDLHREDRQEIESLIDKYSNLFYLNGDRLPGTSTIKHRIEMEDSRPVMVRPYRLPESQKEIINDEMKTLLENGIISPSKSPFNAPLLVVPKKSDPDGKRKYRVVVDFRKLNEKTIGDAYPLPQINEILDQLGHARYFSTLDLASGYHQIQMDPEDRRKTAFSTTFGHFEFNRLPFGLKGGPATFQRLMNNVLIGLQGIKCFVYLDDVVVYGKNIHDHNAKLEEIFKRLEEHSLKLQPSKCNILFREITYLGHRISEKGIRPDEEKLRCVRDFPVPKTHKQIMSYLGLVNYYRKFIPKFSEICRPINNLLKKGIKFEWTKECQTAFEVLREKLINPPVLIMPDFTKPFIITTDASDTAIGAILSQGEIGEDRPNSYASRSLNAAERNYSTIEKEQLAMVWGTNNYRPYVLGRKFTIVTDHKPLLWAFKIKDASSRITRWRLKLEEYDYTIVYKAGKNNTNADALSRIPYDDIICNQVTTRSKTSQNEAIPINDGKDDDQEVRNVTELTSSNSIIELNEVSDIQTVLKEFHDSPIGGHQGIKRTLDKIRILYTWKGMKDDVEKYIKKCTLCQTNKEGHNPKLPMTLTTTSTRTFEKIFLDVVGPMTLTENGNTYVLTMMDDLSKLAIGVPIPDQTANSVAKAFVTKFICVYGCPETILTDQGTNFMSSIFKSACKLLGISKLNTSAYHPQTNGTLERSHHTLATYLKMYTNSAKTDWDEWLPYAFFMYNSTPHSSTKYTPYELVFGKNPNVPSSLQRPPVPLYNYEDYDKILKNRLQSAWQKAAINLKMAKEVSKSNYDRTTKPKEYSVGDMVLYRNHTRQNKLDQLWYGPFPIISSSNVNSKIQIRNKIKNVHNNDLKKYYQNEQ